jgi:hypothetical protein
MTIMTEPPPQPDAEPRVVFPAPPNVPWGVLFGGEIVLAIIAVVLVPRAYWNLVSNLGFEAWAIYICLWIRRLEPGAMSIFWCSAFVMLQLVISVPVGPAPASASITMIVGILALLAFVIWLVTIYLARAELHYHYNVREPIGLYLSGVMTFFFSFLYFQYHLYKIAQLKERNGSRPFYYQGGPPLSLPDQ